MPWPRNCHSTRAHRRHRPPCAPPHDGCRPGPTVCSSRYPERYRQRSCKYDKAHTNRHPSICVAAHCDWPRAIRVPPPRSAQESSHNARGPRANPPPHAPRVCGSEYPQRPPSSVRPLHDYPRSHSRRQPLPTSSNHARSTALGRQSPPTS